MPDSLSSPLPKQNLIGVLFPQGVKDSALCPEFLLYVHFMYNIWQDAGIRTQIASTAARWAIHYMYIVQ